MRGWVAVRVVVVVWGAGVWSAGVGAEEPSRACDAFTADADHVEQTIVMQLEGTRVPLRVPVQYFEDRWDRVDGFEDTAQLFRVDMDDWTSVSRPETAVRIRERRLNYMNFVVGDSVPLEQQALFFARAIGAETPTELPGGQDGPAGLKWLDAQNSSASDEPYKDLFVAQDSSDSLIAVLHCTSPLDPMSVSPGCNQYFRAAGLDVELGYRRASIDRWRELQSDVTAFLTCATRPTP